MAHFDGSTYDPDEDHDRLLKQLARVKRVMSDGEWHTYAAIAARVHAPEPSVGARMRDLRKARFGAHIVERRCLGRGLNVYRLVLNDDQATRLGRERLS